MMEEKLFVPEPTQLDEGTPPSPSEGQSVFAQHTPGPWSVPHFAEPDVNCHCRYVLTDHLMGAVCTVHASGEGDWREAGDNPKFAEAVANAHLIAAAPDLLEALKAILHTYDDGGVPLGKAFKLANAAISKAEGNSEPQPRAPQVDLLGPGMNPKSPPKGGQS